ncbi:hypothetical protein GGR33_003136 [Methylobacterium brachythecii]|uniref:Uncharacterized protein n=1 Tax=Methylobacterium brachythecii TaxID=1176177 RepID=A0A7W6AHV2_9HYPH|nr:hypothetical protein [Methylobacterium brachythecii]
MHITPDDVSIAMLAAEADYEQLLAKMLTNETMH